MIFRPQVLAKKQLWKSHCLNASPKRMIKKKKREILKDGKPNISL